MVSPRTTAIPAVAGGTPVRTDYLIFGSPLIGEAEIDELVATARSGWIGTGPRTKRFEENFAQYQKVDHAIAVSSCTAALHLSLLAASIGPGDEVIVPAVTFVATANSVVHAGAIPVVCDVDRRTGNMRTEDVVACASPRTKAVIPVHLAGRPVEFNVFELAKQRGWIVINDAAHAIETELAGRKISQYGHLSAYSFYPTKNLTTGEGGMVVTASAPMAERIRRLRQHGQTADAWARFSDAGPRHYEAVEAGFKYNMTDMQAAMGLHQLARLEEAALRRRQIWNRYNEAFESLPIDLPAPVSADDRHALHLYSILLRPDALAVDRDEVARALHCEGIGTGVHYRGVHLQPYYRNRFAYSPSTHPNATFISDHTLSLPLSAKLSDRDVEDVIEAVARVLQHYRR
jgi:dTDP-4-amino-4,6-dideoxygalactose transaminase